MSHLTSHRSLWIETVELPSYPTLEETTTVDVAVVGGGIVGILSAYLLRKAGKSVCLIEADQILRAVTGKTTAKLTASHNLIYDYLVSEFDEQAAKQYGQANLAAIDWVEQTAAAEHISCDFKRKNLNLYAETSEDYEDLEKELAAALKAGVPATLLHELDMPFPTSGAVRFPNQAEFHPLKFLAPLAAKIPGKGSHIFEHTRVTKVVEGKGRELNRVITEKGEVHAKQVIIASHFPIFDPALYFTRLSPFRDYAIAFLLKEPVPEEMYVPAGESFTLRSQPSKQGDLLIVSGSTHKVGEGQDTREKYQAIEEWTRKHFKVKEVAFSWSTQDNSTLDKVPYIGRISKGSKNVYVATGFGGWGMTQGVIAAQLLTDLITGKPNELEALYSPLRFKPITSAPELIKSGISNAMHFIGDKLKPGEKKKVSSMKPGEAALLDTPQGKVAVYMGRDKQIHALSPKCTHMGCTVDWNAAEESWDCPCHGSRFDIDGTVLHGPAVHPLEQKELS